MKRSFVWSVVCVAALAMLARIDGAANAVAAPSGPSSAVVDVAVNGLVFADKNANGVADPGEALSGVHLTLTNDSTNATYTAVTGSTGRFSFPAVPAGTYSLTGQAPAGWNLIPRYGLPVPASGISSLQLRAVRPLDGALDAALHLTQHVYRPGDLAHVVVTLSNDSSTQLLGITEECNHVGNAGDLTGMTPGWGDLRETTAGVTIPAHQTRTFDVSERVPTAALDAGVVNVACDFGYTNLLENGRPEASDEAKVPGAFGNFAGDIAYSTGAGQPSVGLRGVRVVIVNAATCPTVTRTTTSDSTGHFSFANLPAGPGYLLFFFPPTGWKFVDQNPSPAFIIGHDTAHFFFAAARGSAKLPSVPARCAPKPSTSSSSSPGVANTGTDSGGQALVAVWALLLGTALLIIGRRRRLH